MDTSPRWREGAAALQTLISAGSGQGKNQSITPLLMRPARTGIAISIYSDGDGNTRWRLFGICSHKISQIGGSVDHPRGLALFITAPGLRAWTHVIMTTCPTPHQRPRDISNGTPQNKEKNQPTSSDGHESKDAEITVHLVLLDSAGTMPWSACCSGIPGTLEGHGVRKRKTTPVPKSLQSSDPR